MGGGGDATAALGNIGRHRCLASCAPVLRLFSLWQHAPPALRSITSCRLRRAIAPLQCSVPENIMCSKPRQQALAAMAWVISAFFLSNACASWNSVAVYQTTAARRKYEACNHPSSPVHLSAASAGQQPRAKIVGEWQRSVPAYHGSSIFPRSGMKR